MQLISEVFEITFELTHICLALRRFFPFCLPLTHSHSDECVLGSKRSPLFCLLIGQKNTKVFWHQSEARTTATVWNGLVRHCTQDSSRRSFLFFVPYFPARLDFLSLPPEKTYKQPTVASPLKSLTSTHSNKLLHLLRRTI